MLSHFYKNPLVTVYIPTYNRLALLKRAIESVRNQNYKNLEIIIVDDCSTDGTQDYLSRIIKEDTRIHYFLKEKNNGACASRNIAIHSAKGEFITGLDDDDYFLDNRISSFIKAWDESENLKALFSKYVILTSSKEKIDNRLFIKERVQYKDLIKENHIGNQVFTKTEYLLKINGFDENLELWQDLDCWYRLLKPNGIAYRIKNPSYVIDRSHSHERISNSKDNKVIETIYYLSQKHDLPLAEYYQLINHSLAYSKNNIDFMLKLRRFIWLPCLTYLRSLLPSSKIYDK